MTAPLVEQVTERQFMDTIVRMAKYLGWRVYHTRDSRGSDPGFPDLCLVHSGRGVIWLECKTEKGRVRPQQREWIDDLQKAGLRAYIVRPSDMDRVEAMLRGEAA